MVLLDFQELVTSRSRHLKESTLLASALRRPKLGENQDLVSDGGAVLSNYTTSEAG